VPYRRYSRKNIRQGDVALCEFHQLRARSGEPRGPGPPDVANEDLPYLGEQQTFEVPVALPDGTTIVRQLRLWLGMVMVIHQNCEIEYADAEDSRLLVAPIVTRHQWPTGPWEEIERGSLPSYFYLREMMPGEASLLGLDEPIPASAVALASTTCVSRGIVKSSRIGTIETGDLPRLQESLVRFFSVRGWGSASALKQLEGLRIVSATETSETVAGPAPLSKVVLAGNGEDDDEITVAWGVRRTGRSL
jgi:hypothetical protein